MLSEYLIFVFFSSLVVSIGWLISIFVSTDRSNLRYGWLILAISLITNLALLLFSTEVIGDPIFDVAIGDLLIKFALPLMAVATVVIGFALSQWRACRKKKSRIDPPFFVAGWVISLLVLSLAVLVWVNYSAEIQSLGSEEQEAMSEDTRTPLEIAAESLPVGFELSEIIPEGTLERPVAFTVGEDGEIYISVFSGGIYKLAPPPWNVEEPKLSVFVAEIQQVTGMVFHDETLYANGSGALVELKDEDGDGQAELSRTLIEGLPSRIYDHHSNNGLVLSSDGRFYFGLGGTTDHGPELDPLAGNILVFDPLDDRLSVYSSGHRNPYDLVFCPSENGQLYSTDNAPDNLNETLRYVPPDELNMVEAGKHYGYPDFFGFPPPWSDSEPPIALMETAGVPAGLECYEGSNFPSEYQGDLFVSLAGGSNPLTGHKIVRVVVSETNGKAIGIVTDFLTNLGRPVDIIEYLDGTLLVLDYDLGQIYQVVYLGN